MQSKPMDEQTVEALERLIAVQVKVAEQNTKILEKLESLNSRLEFANGKIASAEMRQCQTTGEGTDAARMADAFERGQNALVSSHTLRAPAAVEVMAGVRPGTCSIHRHWCQ